MQHQVMWDVVYSTRYILILVTDNFDDVIFELVINESVLFLGAYWDLSQMTPQAMEMLETKELVFRKDCTIVFPW